MSEISSADIPTDHRAPGNLAKYLCLRYRVAHSAEDRFVAEMGSLETLGLEKRDESAVGSVYLAYFSSDLSSEFRLRALQLADSAGIELEGESKLADQDWLAVYRQRVAPFAVGTRWWIDPREPGGTESEVPVGRQLLRIPAWTAFGTGSHVSTALMVRLMEGLRLEGRRVLDVGTGTGILAMVALESGAQRVVALDIDPVAAIIASRTCRLNRLQPQILAGGVQCLQRVAARGAFDAALANVIPARLRADLPAVIGLVKPGATVLLSGILLEQESDLVAELRTLGLHCRSRLEAEGWVALHLERAEP